MTKKNIINGLSILLLISAFSCAPAISQSKRDKKHKEYEEDISSYRPTYDSAQESKDGALPKVDATIVPSNDVTRKLNGKLDTLSRNNSNFKNVQGFRVLVYSGKHSQEVQAVRKKLYEVLPNISIYVDFKSPNQRVKVGDALDRVEAYSLHGKLKKHFPNAVIIPDQVVIK